MIEIAYRIDSTNGIHARIAESMVRAAQKYTVDVKLIYKDKVVDIKSILGLMSLAVPHGVEVILTSSGENSEQAIRSIIHSIEKFK